MATVIVIDSDDEDEGNHYEKPPTRKRNIMDFFGSSSSSDQGLPPSKVERHRMHTVHLPEWAQGESSGDMMESTNEEEKKEDDENTEENDRINICGDVYDIIEEKSNEAEEPGPPSEQLELYYVSNFQLIIGAVLSMHGHLFNDSETEELNTIMNGISREAKCLFLRLCQRKGPIFRQASISYPEVPNVMESTTELANNGLCNIKLGNDIDTKSGTKAAMEAMDLVNLLQRKELDAIYKEIRSSLPGCYITVKEKNFRDICELSEFFCEILKFDLVENDGEIGGFFTSSKNALVERRSRLKRKLMNSILGTVGVCMELKQSVLRNILLILNLFFLSDFHHSAPESVVSLGAAISNRLSTLVLANMNKVNYQKYEIDRSNNSSVFSSRGHLIEYSNAVDVEGINSLCLAGDYKEEGNFEHDLADTRCPILVTKITNMAAVKIAAGRKYKAVVKIDRQNQSRFDKFIEKHTEMAVNKILAVLCEENWGNISVTDLYKLRYRPSWVWVRMLWSNIAYFEKAKQFETAICMLQLLLGYWPVEEEEEVTSTTTSSNVGKFDLIPGLAIVSPSAMDISSLKQPYCSHYRGQWYDRLSVDLVHVKRKHDAVLVCKAGLADRCIPSLCAERRTLENRLTKLSTPPPIFPTITLRTPGRLELTAHLRTKIVGKKSLFSPWQKADSHELVGVEEFALQYYQSRLGGGWKGMHCESSVFRTIFTLLMWDIIFMNGIDGVFQTPFQNAPLDLCTPTFYVSREEKILELLHDMSTWEKEDIMKAVCESWHAHMDTECRGMNWSLFEMVDIADICVCLGRLGLIAICYVLCQNYREWCRGVPDLVVWDNRTGKCKVVEVKGPRDRCGFTLSFFFANQKTNSQPKPSTPTPNPNTTSPLRLSDRQRLWIDILLSAGVSAEICWVKELCDNPSE